GWPVTSGMLRLAGAGGGGGGGGGGGAPPPEPLPFERLSRTFAPRGTLTPARGCWATTWPFGCAEGTVKTCGTRPAPRKAETAVERLWPTRSGTRTAPRETRITTVDPFATAAPPVGLWLSTMPAGLREPTLAVSTARPCERRARIATAVLSPTTSGTWATVVEATDSVTTEPRLT